jgi:hypothetical protein
MSLLVAAAPVPPVMAMPLMPRTHAAVALICPNLFAPGAKVAPPASVDTAALVTSEARLLRSDAVGHQPHPQQRASQSSQFRIP